MQEIMPVITILLILVILLVCYFGFLEHRHTENKLKIENKSKIENDKDRKISRDDLISIINFYNKDYGNKYVHLVGTLKISNNLLAELDYGNVSTSIFYTYFTPYIKYMRERKILSKKEVNMLIPDINNINTLMKQELKKKLTFNDTLARIEFNIIQNEVKTKLEMNNFEREVRDDKI